MKQEDLGHVARHNPLPSWTRQRGESSKMTPTPKEIVSKLLANTTNLSIVKELVAHDATYVSLNRSNPELTSIEPWCGLHEKTGPEAIYQTFVDVGTYWTVEKFDVRIFYRQRIKLIRSRLKLHPESTRTLQYLALFDIDQTPWAKSPSRRSRSGSKLSTIRSNICSS